MLKDSKKNHTKLPLCFFRLSFHGFPLRRCSMRSVLFGLYNIVDTSWPWRTGLRTITTGNFSSRCFHLYRLWSIWSSRPCRLTLGLRRILLFVERTTWCSISIQIITGRLYGFLAWTRWTMRLALRRAFTDLNRTRGSSFNFDFFLSRWIFQSWPFVPSLKMSQFNLCLIQPPLCFIEL